MFATARAHANIAFIKYWGNQDNVLRLPSNGSISMNLDGLYTETTVKWLAADETDSLVLNGERQTGRALDRVVQHLEVIRRHLRIQHAAAVESHNNFPMGTGIASSAAAFAALTTAAVAAIGRQVDEATMSRLARQGSGSASRSVPTGFVEWYAADTDRGSYAESIAPPYHWNLIDLIAIVSDQHKAVVSQQGHTTAQSSDLQAARVAGAPERLEMCRNAIMDRDFPALAEVVEHDSNLMHAVMMTSHPPLFYWLPTTLTLMNEVRIWRNDGLDVCYTLDAGPNVHCICREEHAEETKRRLSRIPGILDIRMAKPGQGAQVIAQSSSD